MCRTFNIVFMLTQFFFSCTSFFYVYVAALTKNLFFYIQINPQYFFTLLFYPQNILIKISFDIEKNLSRTIKCINHVWRRVDNQLTRKFVSSLSIFVSDGCFCVFLYIFFPLMRYFTYNFQWGRENRSYWKWWTTSKCMPTCREREDSLFYEQNVYTFVREL
jgi:hypothetical protein